MTEEDKKMAADSNPTLYDKYKEQINPFLSGTDTKWFLGYTGDGYAIEKGSCKLHQYLVQFIHWIFQTT